jgi:hypothetical protein
MSNRPTAPNGAGSVLRDSQGRQRATKWKDQNPDLARLKGHTASAKTVDEIVAMLQACHARGEEVPEREELEDLEHDECGVGPRDEKTGSCRALDDLG